MYCTKIPFGLFHPKMIYSCPYRSPFHILYMYLFTYVCKGSLKVPPLPHWLWLQEEFERFGDFVCFKNFLEVSPWQKKSPRIIWKSLFCVCFLSGTAYSCVTHNSLQGLYPCNSHLRTPWWAPKWESGDSEQIHCVAGDSLAWAFLDGGSSVINQD